MNRITSGSVVACLFVFGLIASGAGMADTSTTQPPATQPATPPQPPSPEVLDWLDRIQKKSRDIKTFQGNLIYDRNQGLVGDKQRRFGTVTFAAGPPKKFDIHFDSVLVDGRKDDLDDSFIYDGVWLVERNGKDKTFTKRQLVAPGTPADQADPLDTGEGPFVLPITTDKDRLLKRFDISLVPPDSTDPPNTIHLKLIPRPDHKSDLTRADIWYDRNSLVPVRVKTTDGSENETVIQVKKARVNEPVKRSDFDTGEPGESGWHVEVTPWEDNH